MQTPYGPRTLGARSQVVVPAQIAEALHLESGDELWFTLDEERPGCALLVPGEIASAVWEEGWQRRMTPAEERDENSEA